MVDLRGLAAHRRLHPRGAISIPASRLPSSLFLLPPKNRTLTLLARNGAEARKWAGWLRRKGWLDVRWLDGAAARWNPADCRSGIEPSHLWEPAPLLERHAQELPVKGICCDLACGSGRNSAFLALRGLDVIGVDILLDALRQARALARASGIPTAGLASSRSRSSGRVAGAGSGRVWFRRGDLTDPRVVSALLRPGRFDLLLCFRYLDRSLFPPIAATIKPGGWLMFETFLEQQARAKGKPKRPAYLLRPGELRLAFPGFEVIEYREGEDAEGNWIASLVARNRVG